jgi:hypothetical protein
MNAIISHWRLLKLSNHHWSSMVVPTALSHGHQCHNDRLVMLGWSQQQSTANLVADQFPQHAGVSFTKTI